MFMKRVVGFFFALLICCAVPVFSHSKPTPETIFTDKWALGNILAESSDYVGAIHVYSEAIEIGKEVMPAMMLKVIADRASIFAQLEDFNSAVSDYSCIINDSDAQKSDIINALYGRMSAYSKLGDKVRVVEDATTIIENDPELPTFKWSKDYLIIENSRYLINSIKKREGFKQSFVNSGLCKTPDSVVFSTGDTCIVKLNLCCGEEGDGSCCEECAIAKGKKPKDDNAKRSNIKGENVNQCFGHCADALSIGELFCASLPNRFCVFNCMVALKAGYDLCKYCCAGGNFYEKCVKWAENLTFECYLDR